MYFVANSCTKIETEKVKTGNFIETIFLLISPENSYYLTNSKNFQQVNIKKIYIYIKVCFLSLKIDSTNSSHSIASLRFQLEWSFFYDLLTIDNNDSILNNRYLE